MSEKDPLFGFWGDKMKEYVENKPIIAGDEMMLYEGQYNQHSYRIVQVVEVDHGRQRRIIVSVGGAWGGRSFYRNGKSCFSPKGQTHLIPVIDSIKKQMSSKGKVIFDLTWEKII